MGPMVFIKNYTFNHFYSQYFALLTMVLRNSCPRTHMDRPALCKGAVSATCVQYLETFRDGILERNIPQQRDITRC